MDKKMTDLEKQAVAASLPQMMAGMRVPGNVTCDGAEASTSTPADKDATLRDRLLAVVEKNARPLNDSQCAAVLAWHRSELSRAGGERTDEVEKLREQLASQKRVADEWRATSGRIVAFLLDEECLVAMPDHTEELVREKVGELKRQLAAVEAASWKANIDKLRALEDGWNSYQSKKPKKAALEVAEFVHASPLANGGIQIDFGADRSVEISPEGVLSCEGCEVLRDRLAAIEAARAKAMEDEAAEFTEEFRDMDGHEEYAVILNELRRRATVIASQAQELEQLRAARAGGAATIARMGQLLWRIHDHLVSECHGGIRNMDEHQALMVQSLNEGVPR